MVKKTRSSKSTRRSISNPVARVVSRKTGVGPHKDKKKDYDRHTKVTDSEY